MSARLNPVRIADDVFEFQVDTPADAQALATHLRASLEAEDIVAGLDRVAVRFDPRNLVEIETRLRDTKQPETARQTDAPLVEIGIQYGGEYGPDLASVCDALDLTEDAFIAAHTAPVHTVEMIGFTPGFSYISGLPAGFSVPRLARPRPRVPDGSVGISAAFTGIYALNGPGGWPLIGRTHAQLFRANDPAPFLLTPGQSVQFRAL
nr:carboxyltransferase domain-containing protein [Hyphomonas sp. Mor2]